MQIHESAHESALEVSLLSNAVAITNHIDDFVRYTRVFNLYKESAIG
jgi:hypothetical protein